MTMEILSAADRGRTRLDWLDSRHSFSFGSYFDPARTGFGPLVVLNDDVIEAGRGFAPHAHRDTEILTYLVRGSLEHRDDLGSVGRMGAGDVQRMSAGTGIRHSEWNASATEPLRLLQIWIQPDRSGHAPSYDQRALACLPGTGHLQLAASGDGRDGSLALHRDVDVYVVRLAAGDSASHALASGRGAWIQVVSGALEAGGRDLGEGDGAAVTGAESIELYARSGAEALLLDLAPRDY